MIPRRYVIVLMIFISSCYIDMIRMNLSVNIVAMVPVTNNTLTDTKNTLTWSAYERGLVLASYNWGYLPGNLVGGFVGQRFGPKLVMFIAILGGGILTLLSPIAAMWGYIPLVAIRVFMGILGGMRFPCSYILIANWAMPTERGMFVGALIGGNIGTFFSWTICGFAIDAFGWDWGFYAFVTFLPFLLILWWYLVFDSPVNHPYISSEETKYLSDRVDIRNDNKVKVPISKFLTSVPALSLLVLGFSTGWGISVVTISIPSYMANALDYDIRSTGYLSALTYLLRSSSAFAIGSSGDMILRRKFISLNVLRKGGTIFSHILPGCGLILMALPNFPRIVYVLILIISMGLNGFVTISSAVNIYDLTPNYAGALSGFPQGLLSCAGIITPMVTAHLIKDDETSLDLWQLVLYLTALIYIIGGLQFIIFGSTKRQSWDKSENDN